MADATKSRPDQCPGGRNCTCCGPGCDCGCVDTCRVYLATKRRGDTTPTFEYRLIRIDNDLTTEELPLDRKLAQAMDTCLRMGLPIAPRGLRPKLQEAREFLKGIPIEEIGGKESGVANDTDR